MTIQTRSLWSHITGKAIQGKLKGKQLKPLASMPQIEWNTWMTNYPNTKVLSIPFRGTMVESLRNDTYQRYHTSQDTGVSGMKYTDNRLPNKSLVIGVQVQRKYGEDGLPGQAGADGQDGAPGQAGADGQDGTPGAVDDYSTQYRAYPLTQFTKTAMISDTVNGVPLLIFHGQRVVCNRCI